MASGGARRLATASTGPFSGVTLYDAHQRALLAEHRFIPIEAFAYFLEQGDLREAIARHAPGLMDSLG
jgi:hypothetical protein